MITRTILVNITPKEIANVLAQMDDIEQAKFFNEFAELVAKHSRPFCFQLQYIRDNGILTPLACDIMRQIGEYSCDNGVK